MSNPIMRPFGIVAGRWMLSVCIVIALIMSNTFHKGLIPDDGYTQLAEAKSHEYTNLHPPLMAMITSVLYHPKEGFVFIFQPLLFLTGIGALLSALAKRWKVPTYAPFAILAGMVFALPTLALSMSYTKDVWLAAALVWFAALVVSGGARSLYLAAVVAAVGLCFRHNAVVLLPLIFTVLWRAGGWRVAVLSAVLFGTIQFSAMRAAKDAHPEAQVKVLDLVGLSRFGVHVPYVESFRVGGTPAGYGFTDQGGLNAIVDFDKMAYADSAALSKAHKEAVSANVAAYISYRIAAYTEWLTAKPEAPLLHSWRSGTRQPEFTDDMGFREPLRRWTAALCANPIWRWINTGLTYLVFSAVLFFMCRKLDKPLQLGALLAPMYLLSFAPATVNTGFRFLLPSVLLAIPFALIFLRSSDNDARSGL